MQHHLSGHKELIPLPLPHATLGGAQILNLVSMVPLSPFPPWGAIPSPLLPQLPKLH